ncbi:MAG: toll/interleukin-1 receptor domain-containing protein [Ideonella sp.]
MAGGIFVSYRRDDARQAAGRLADDLAQHFGTASIFRDIEGIELGVDFVEALNRALEACVVMLVLIGPRWLDIRDAKGQRRLDDPKDWIRQEISTALKRGIRVVPVLIDGTPLPDEEALPEDLQPLVRRQALEIADNRWRGDMQRLAETLARVPGVELKRTAADSTAAAPPPTNPPPLPAQTASGGGKQWLKMGIYGLVAIGIVGYLADQFGAGEGSQPSMPSFAPAQAPMAAPAQAPLVTPSQTPLVSTPAPAGNAPTVPNLAGMWRTLDGETYQVTQQGNQINLTAFASGQNVGGGRGQIDGQLLRLTMTMVINGVPLAAANCNLLGTPDFSRFAGTCESSNGPFAAQMFR